MAYRVIVIDDDALPDEYGWALIEVDGGTVFVVKESAVGLESVADGWAAFRLLDRRPSPPRLDEGRVPLQLARA